jgi:hypothetical protein
MTDTRTALTRGLKEYLESLRGVLAGGRELRFVQVMQVWTDTEVPAKYPAACVTAPGTGTYDANAMSPKTIKVPNNPGVFLRQHSELVQDMTVEVWCTDVAERMAMVALVEDLFEPVDWMTGFRLELPHYYNARATFEKMALTYIDSGDDAQRRWRRAVFAVRGTVPQLRAFGEVPLMRPRTELEVDGLPA